ncbi:phage tail protein [Zavarzinella formosa]|uniref:phage tail protein n=1 Tax=Zavarzinella formosa TaxID=360055 RepID=UPI0002FD6746|nr:phage tail protein [Zavarzinella formosa]
MPAVIPLVGAIAGAITTAELATATVPFFAFGAGGGLATALGITAGTASLAVAGVAGFVVATAIDTVGAKAFSPKTAPLTSSLLNSAAQSRAVQIRSAVESHKIIYGRAKVSGPLVYVSATDTGTDNNGTVQAGSNRFIHIVIALAGHEVASIPTIYFNDTPVTLDGGGFVTDSPYMNGGHSFARVLTHLGSPTQAADSSLVSECGLDSNFRLQGIAYLYARLEFDKDIFATGIPNISAVVNGKKVFDPRDSTTSFKTNAALCARDYLTSDYGFNCDASEINDAYWIAAANGCDESVSLSGGGSQARYACNGVLDTAAAPIENLNQLVAAMAGTVTYVQGQFRGYAGVFNATVGDIDTGMLAGSVKIHTRSSRQQLFNAVQGTYTDPDKNWQPTDFPPVTNLTYKSQDGGDQIFKDIALPLTNHPEASQRIAKVILEQGRQGIQVELTLNHTAIPFAVYDTVTFTDEALGWDHKVFRIKKFSVTGTGPVILSLQEESSAAYDWNSGMATTADPAPDTNLPDPFTVRPPSSLAIDEALYVTRDGAGVKSSAIMTWLPSTDAFFQIYQPEFKPAAGSVWTSLSRTVDPTQTIYDISPDAYDFRVKAINTLGVSSAYATASKQISGLLAPPAEPRNMGFAAIGGLVFLNWDASPDLDVRIGGSYVFRYSPTASDGWTNSTGIGPAIPGTSTHALLPLKPGIYLGKATDSSGIESTNAASVVVTQDSILAFSVIGVLTEDATFGGSKTNCTVSGGMLQMTDPALLTGEYLFHARMDLTTVQNVRLTAHVQAAVFNVSDLIDSRTGLIDDWLSIDGDTSAAADFQVYVRSTQDDPNGAPAWTDWNLLHSGEFGARGFDFKGVFTTTDPTYNIAISELNIKAATV